jgi:4-amino-4-deoxy-L-arabinose transferase-like glycosyltransferase
MLTDDVGKSARGLALLAAVLAAVMFVFPLCVSFPLLDPDEGLHASIAQAMVERGDWITPQFLGRPFLDKPILYFWVQAASLWLLGPSEAAVRLPGLMFGLLGAATTGLLGWRMFGRTTGLLSGILYATTILPTALAQAASHDVALIPWINLSLLLLWEADRAATLRAAVGRLVGAGALLGLAILTKGLFGVAVVGLAFGGYLLITRRISLKHILHGMAVLVVAVLVASPWYGLVAARNPKYLEYFFLERHVLGLFTGSQPHGDGPWWYYLPVLLGGGLPWIGYLPSVVQDGLARRKSAATPAIAQGNATENSRGLTAPGEESADPRTFRGLLAPGYCDLNRAMRGEPTPLLWSWLIGWTLVMTLARSKLATYLWPAFPPVAVLAAMGWARFLDGTLSAAARRSLTRTFAWSSWSGPILLPAAVLALQAIFAVRLAWPVWAVAIVAAAVAPLPLIPWRAGRWQAGLAAATLSLAVQFVAVMTMVVPPVAEACSARVLAEHFNRQGRLPPRLLVAEGRLGALVFYLDPQLRAGIKTDQLQQLPAEELPPPRPGDVIAVPERKARRLRGRVRFDLDRYESVGSYRLYTITAAPSGAPSDRTISAAGRS